MRLAGILFDKDGTLVDFHRTWGRATGAVIRSFAGRDEAMAERLAAVMEYDVRTGQVSAASLLIAGSMAQVLAAWATVLDRVDDPDFVAELNEAFATQSLAALAPLGDPDAVLTALAARGLRLGLATNDAEASARKHLAALGLDAHFAFIAGYDSGHGGKPDPGMVLAFAAEAGFAPGEVALVGDTLHDLHAARAAGAVGVAVLTGPAGRDELAPYADHVIDSIADLPALVDRLG